MKINDLTNHKDDYRNYENKINGVKKIRRNLKNEIIKTEKGTKDKED